MSVNVSMKFVSECFFHFHRFMPIINNSTRHICSHILGDGSSENYNKNINNKEWMQRLTPLQYEVCRLKGTERPFTSPYIHTHFKGTYCCVCCGSELFSSETKFDSGSGWPSFFSCIPDKIEEKKDTSHGMVRVEVLCKNCNAHLGHVFDDGPKPTGHRYCINGVCLNFKEQ